MAKKKTTKAAVQKKEAASKRKATAPKAPKFNSPVNEEDKALFLQTLPKIADLKAKLNTANANLRNAYKTAKKDGFLKGDFDVAFQIQGADGEKAKKAAIARDLTIAKWLGCDLGAQLDLFVEDERVPAVDRAYEEGQAASMKGESAKPGYDPSTEQHRSYMKGFHDDQEKRIKGGIKKTDEPETPGLITEKQKAAAKGKETPAKANGKVEEPSSGVPMTRAQYAALKQQQNTATGADDIEEVTVTEPAFKRKGDAAAS